jgi:hypothetical protein
MLVTHDGVAHVVIFPLLLCAYCHSFFRDVSSGTQNLLIWIYGSLTNKRLSELFTLDPVLIILKRIAVSNDKK